MYTRDAGKNMDGGDEAEAESSSSQRMANATCHGGRAGESEMTVTHDRAGLNCVPNQPTVSEW